MQSGKPTVLIVDDVAVNRKILAKLLAEDYDACFAENGEQALRVLEEKHDELTAIILDLMMPVMDGYAFMEAFNQVGAYHNIPVIVTTGSSDRQNETRALRMGAWDFISKPYDGEIIRFRLQNAIIRSRLGAFNQLKYQVEFDRTTGIYNKDKFLADTTRLIRSHPDALYDVVRLDIDRFQLVNSFFGTAKGDELIRYIADLLKNSARGLRFAAYGHIEADVFALCVPHRSEEEHRAAAVRFQQALQRFDLSFDLVPSIGVYAASDRTLPAEMMYDRAGLAAKSVKGSYVEFCAFYTDKMSERLEKEQRITNEMNNALKEHQFVVYLQPKYSLQTGLPAGAEALVRWMSPEKGMISPGDFIPLFERNGFISKLDYYMWESVCKLLRGWIDAGIKPLPISVNVSRVNVYNPRLVDMICELTEKYNVPHELLNLELTESVYTDNPQAMKDTMRRLHERGFVVMMDDFGSGYSSLNILKDIPVDVIKIDMRFFSTSEIAGRGENIIAAVVRMTKWLNMPTIAEGVETEDQVEFLRSIGCECVQGFYYARPMPVADYEKLAREGEAAGSPEASVVTGDSIWSNNPQMENVFSNVSQAVAIFEYAGDHVEILRVNRAYHEMFGYEDVANHSSTFLDTVEPEYAAAILASFRTARDKESECDFLRGGAGEMKRWFHLRMKYISDIGGKSIVMGVITDITAQKEIDLELQKYKRAASRGADIVNRVLIVDDVKVNRILLEAICKGRFETLEAANGQEALDVLAREENRIDIILLDLNMPVMDGIAFLNYKKTRAEISDIPVIIITADDTPEQQVNTLALGANDYIVKPFVEEVVMRRVNNVLESNRRFRDMLREYNNVVELSQTDPLTHILNRAAATETIDGALSRSEGGALHALVMIDIDNFKTINDRYGHDVGDNALISVAETLRRSFRSHDVVARFGGDEFCVFLPNIPTEAPVLKKCSHLCAAITSLDIPTADVRLSVSIGVALTDEAAKDFAALYKHADQALYQSKIKGKNQVSLFGGQTEAVSGYWIDKDWMLEAMEEAVLFVDCQTLEILYASKKAQTVLYAADMQARTCHELLYGRAERCDGCFLAELRQDAFRTRVMDVNGKTYLTRARRVAYHDRDAALVVATELPPQAYDETVSFCRQSANDTNNP